MASTEEKTSVRVWAASARRRGLETSRPARRSQRERKRLATMPRPRRAAEKTADGGAENFPGAEKEEAGDNDGGEDFEFAVAVRVAGVGRAGGSGDADEGDDAGSAVEQGVDGIGEDAQTAQLPADAKFDGGEDGVDGEGGEEDPADPGGAGGFAHGRRSAMPPAHGPR
jgi:hypothetical protein